jgi:hypothetical protein
LNSRVQLLTLIRFGDSDVYILFVSRSSFNKQNVTAHALYQERCRQAAEQMRTTIKTLIIVFGILGQSCSRTDEQFEKLLKSPEKYHRQEIEIRGIIHKRFEDTAIYLTEGSPREDAVWIEYTKLIMSPETFDKLDGRKVRVKGIFDVEDKGHLDQYVGALKLAIMEIDE